MDISSIASDTESTASQSVRRSSRLAAKRQPVTEPEADATTPLKSIREVASTTTRSSSKTPERSPSRKQTGSRTPRARATKISTPSKEPTIQEVNFEDNSTPKSNIETKIIANPVGNLVGAVDETHKTPTKSKPSPAKISPGKWKSPRRSDPEKVETPKRQVEKITCILQTSADLSISPQKSTTAKRSESTGSLDADFPKILPFAIICEGLTPDKIRESLESNKKDSPKKSNLSLTPAKRRSGVIVDANDELQRQKDEEKEKAAIKLQSCWRGFLARKEYKREKMDAKEKLQRQKDAAKNKAAIKLQTHWRGFLARKEYKREKMNAKEELQRQKDAEKEKAAIKLQTHWRRFLARKEYKREKMNAKEELQRQKDAEKEKAAIKLQAYCRGFLARKEYKRKKMDAKEKLQRQKVAQELLPPSKWPKIKNAKKLFEMRGKMDANLLNAIKANYEFLNKTGVFSSILSDQLVKPNEEEMVWQQVAFQNKLLFKKFRKIKDGFEEQLEGSKDSDNEEQLDEEVEENGEELGDDDELVDDEEVDLFNLKAEDFRNIDQQLEALESETDEIQDLEPKLKKVKRPKKSIVDDQFFKLSEMEAFLDAEDNKDYTNGVFDEVEDEQSGLAYYKYADFFEEGQVKKKKKIKRKLENDELVEEKPKKVKKSKKKVHFEIEKEDESSAKVLNENEEPDKRVLLGPVEENEQPQTSFQATQEKMKKKISKLEEENLAPKSWELVGEITGLERDKDTLLDTYLSVDFRAKHAPNISVDTTEKLEAMIIQRIKDKAFDDVERKVRLDESIKPYRNEALDDTVRKSLTEVYEERYQKTQENIKGKKTEEIDPQVKEIEGQMSDLFKMLDAMSHYMFKPPEITPEVKIVHNVAALRAEEVGPLASTAADETLLAPEELAKHLKGNLKATDERTQTDRLRERRKKKRKQHDMAKHDEERKFKKPKLDVKNEQLKKKKVKSKQNGNKDFFTQLQETSVQEIKEKVKKKDKIKNSDEKKVSGSKYKL